MKKRQKKLTPAEEWEKLNNLMKVAKNPATSVNILVDLSSNEEDMIREEVAKNPSTPPFLLNKMVEDRFWNVVIGIAKNPSTPITTLIQLSKNEHKELRKAAQENPSFKKS